MKIHFETDQNRQLYLLEWRTTTFLKIINENPDKNRLECLQILFDKLRKIQQGLGSQKNHDLREQILNTCQGIPECRLALCCPADTYEGVCAQLRFSVNTIMQEQELKTQQFNIYIDNEDSENPDPDS